MKNLLYIFLLFCFSLTAQVENTTGVNAAFVAGENIANADWVHFGSDGKLYKADPTDPSKDAIAFCPFVIMEDSTGMIYFSGIQYSILFILTPGKAYYLVPGGFITDVKPSSRYQYLGTAISTQDMFLSIQPSKQVTEWADATRPRFPEIGATGFNTDSARIEYWDGAAWVNI